MTPADREVAEFKRRDAKVAAFVHGSMGAFVGALAGFYVWSSLSIRFGLADTWWGFATFMSLVVLSVGGFAACLKERFWQDWRSPFWWP